MVNEADMVMNINADTGIRMDEEFLKRAFEPYAQKNNTSLDSINGVGLGLAIVKQMVERMGGRIKVESKVNEGTKYTILLPFKIDPDPVIRKKTEEPVSLKGVKALLVEDNNLNMEISKFYLEQEEVEVYTATNGQEAVDMFMKSKIGFYDNYPDGYYDADHGWTGGSQTNPKFQPGRRACSTDHSHECQCF